MSIKGENPELDEGNGGKKNKGVGRRRRGPSRPLSTETVRLAVRQGNSLPHITSPGEAKEKFVRKGKENGGLVAQGGTGLNARTSPAAGLNVNKKIRLER